ncbi:MAG: hypothetical protein M3P49_15180 [Actinomycetota bacterium]|nr:hypothetical protein [Actinomycetota bacterium]
MSFIGCGGLVALVLLLGAVGAFIGGGAEEVGGGPTAPEEPGEAEVSEPTEETTKAPPEPTKEEAMAEPEKREPPPRTPKDELRARISKKFVEGEEVRKIAFQKGEGGCQNVQVDYNEPMPGMTTEYQMEEVYRAAYRPENLRRNVCSVTVTIYGEQTDEYGQSSELKLYSTTIGQKKANRINWEPDSGANLPQLWKVNYIDPSMEQAIAEDEAEMAIDCAVDEGLFDNWLCPE